MMTEKVHIIGAGLAGCEAACQLAKRGIRVKLYDMKPAKKTPAHSSDYFAELVCSNSLRASRLESAPGLLKEELRRLGSLIIACADSHSVPAGGALAVDREAFAKAVTDYILNEPLIEFVSEERSSIPEDGYTIIATGPLTSKPLSEAVQALIGKDYLYFYDAASPIVTRESIDFTKVFQASRYDKGSDYLNCPMTEEDYERFWLELVSAETAPLELAEEEKVFEGCMPVEVMAGRGKMTLAYGPLKPMGLSVGGKRPYAVVQLRQDNIEGTLYNLVGFQTHLKFGEQKRVFSLIPGLENAEFVRYGVMHRNTFINAPGLLDHNYRLIKKDHIYFAGQITGVEGYIESVASGLLAGIALAYRLMGLPPPDLTDATATGALGSYISRPGTVNFQPTNINFGIIDHPVRGRMKKTDKNMRIAQNALNIIDEFVKEEQLYV